MMWERAPVADHEPEEIRIPDEPARLLQHAPVDVLITLRAAQGEERTVLAGRCTTPHLRPNGTIVVVRPQLDAGRMPPLKRADTVRVRLKRSGNEVLEADGVVSWVRPKAFLPSGQAVSLVGVTFSWDADERVLEVAAFLARPSLPPSS
jgi:hypothetical protein